jgi:hypothetical protein
MRSRRFVLAVQAVFLLLAGATSSAHAQFGPFGQNKVQYRDFDWLVISGPRVDVYYYPEEEQIARMALTYAESAYVQLEYRLNHTVTQRIPLIVYASHTDFEQTNVLPFVPEEGILGVTEYLKRRVTVPFRGSYSEFRHTIQHELVHVFQLSMATQAFQLYPRGHRAGTPLWWSEGLAEYLSSPQDTRDDMVVRDLVLAGRMPSIGLLNQTLSALVYPVGAELHAFLGDKYGDWRIPLLYQSLWKFGSFDEAMTAVYGKTPEQLTEEWHYALRQRYYPEVAGRAPIQVPGNQIAELALKPVSLGEMDGKQEIAYLSPGSGYTNIYHVPLSGSARPEVMVKGQRNPQFESFHESYSRMDSRNGVLVFGSKFGDRDALFFWDVEKAKVAGRYQFDSLVTVLSPSWSPDGNSVVFSGLSVGGLADLYELELSDGSLRRLTKDRYEDVDPSYMGDPDHVVFSSDRGPGGDDGALNLYSIETSTGEIRPLTSGPWRDESPRWDPDDARIYFTSDRDGTFNLYSIDSTGDGRRETRVDGGLFDPAPVKGDDRLAITGFSGLTWSLYTIGVDSAAHSETFALVPPDTIPAWNWEELASARSRTTPRHYQPDYSIDFAAGVASTGGGSVSGPQGAQLVISDLLGDHLFGVSLASYQVGGSGDFLDNLNGSVAYLNQSQRLNWGAGAFRIAGTFFESDFSQLYRETSLGGYGSVQYPISRFLRLEGYVSVEHSDRDDFANSIVTGNPRRVGFLTGNFISLVGDNTLWLNTGPIDGTRFNLTGGVVSDVSHAEFENWTGSLDVRRYFRTSLQSAFAVRTFGYISQGTRPRAVQLAGSWMLRGYPRYSIAGTRVWLLNTEWRFPITNYVTVGFPFGAIRFPQLQGAFFSDLGQAWIHQNYDPRVLGSAGVGFRMALFPGLVLRLDLGKRFSLNGDPNAFNAAAFRQSFADFFIGYNY